MQEDAIIYSYLIYSIFNIYIAESLPNSDGFNVDKYSLVDVMMFSLNSNSSTNWITSFDLGKYSEYANSFEVDDKIYIALKGTYDQFWVF